MLRHGPRRILVRITRAIAYGSLLLTCTCSLVWSQGAPMSADAFIEGGGSFIGNTGAPWPSWACPLSTSGSSACPRPIRFGDAGRLFTGVRFRKGQNAFEASYSYSDNPTIESTVYTTNYNRLDLYSFNYIRYLGLKSAVEPFTTIGAGASRFTGPSNPRTDFKFVWNFGGGGDVPLYRHVALRLELRNYVGGQPAYWTGTSHNIVPSAGLVFKFSEVLPHASTKRY
jgi:hypothetical protein